MASRFSFYSFPGYEFLNSTITFFDINNLIADICNCIFTSELSPFKINYWYYCWYNFWYQYCFRYLKWLSY